MVGDHHMIEEGHQEAAIGAFLVAHEGHAQVVEVQRGAWTIYCRCTRCDDVRTYEVDNEARERAIGLPPWPEVTVSSVVVTPSARERFTPRELTEAYKEFREHGKQYLCAESGLGAAAYRFGMRVLVVYYEGPETGVVVLLDPSA